MSKICSNCGKEVEDTANFCPACKCQTFTNKNSLVTSDKDSWIYKLFYWNHDGKYVLSKTKITSICTFLFCMLFAFEPEMYLPVVIIFSALIAIFVFLAGYGLHTFIKPSQAKIDNNDYGLGEDLKHLLCYWQETNGVYVFSKTKIICHIIFLIFFIYARVAPDSTLEMMPAIVFALVFEVPAFLIGFAVHRLTNKHPVPVVEKKEVSQPKIRPAPQTVEKKQSVPEYQIYVSRIDELNSKFIKKDKSVRNEIEKKFEPPQLTYTRFITGVDKSKELFNKNMYSALNMINIADEYSPRIAGEIESKIDIMHEIIDKIDGLLNELIINDDLSKKEDVDGLISEMDDLIDSVKSYE